LDKELKKKTLKIPKNALCFSEEADIALTPSEDGKRYFSMRAFSGKIIKNHSWWGNLAIDVSGIQFTQKRFPILEEHFRDSKIGVANSKPSIDNNEVNFSKIALLNNEKAKEFEQNLSDGFPYQASLSIRPRKIEELEEGTTAEVNGYKMKGPGRIIRESIFREASVCVFGVDSDTGVAALSDEAESYEVQIYNLSEQDEGDEDVVENNDNNNKSGGNSMDLKQLEKEQPDLFKKIQKDLSDRDEQITSLTNEKKELEAEVQELEKEKTDLSDEQKKNEERIANLEKAETVRREKDMQNHADKIVAEKLSESEIPKRLYSRVKRNIDFNDFVKDEALSVEDFKSHVDTEIKSWADDLKAEFADSSTILGLSTGDSSNHHDKEKEGDELSDTLVGFVSEAIDEKK